MKTITTLCLATVLSLLGLNSSAQNTTATFSTATTSTAKITNLSAAVTNGKVLLNWSVEENQNANQFEVEKSTNGTDFTMAALVFGTDKKSTENYMFYEKAKNTKTSYRVKIILTNGSIVYSPVVIAESGSNTTK